MEADKEGKAISLSISGVFDLPIVAGPLLPGALYAGGLYAPTGLASSAGCEAMYI